jgi:hypothetical protein
MDHPPAQGQKLPAFFHRLTSYENSYQQSAISYQQKKKARVDRDNPHVGCALRTMAFSRHSCGGCATFTLPNNKAFPDEITPAAPFYLKIFP